MALNDISLTAGMRSNLLSLQNTVKLLDRTQERLSTGKKVNTAIDNPVSYFAAQSLNSRASVIDSLKDAMGQAVQTVKAADKGITAITAMIEQAKGIAQEALSVEPTTSQQVTGQATIDVTYGSEKITAAGDAGSGTVTIGGVTFTHTTGGEAPRYTSLETLATAINSNNTLHNLGYTAVFTDAGGDAVIVTRLNADVGAVTYSNNAAGESTAHSEEMSFTIGGTTITTQGATAGAAAAALETELGALQGVDSARVTTRGAVTVTYEAEDNDEFIALVGRYNEIRNQLDTIARDSGYKGKNLLASDIMTVKFEGSHNLEVVGFDASTKGLGVGEADWAANPAMAEAAINVSIIELDNAAVTLRSEASKLSGNLSIITVRQDFSDNMINTLIEGADKLTLADANEEGANMLMLQTRQSLSTTALSLSAQAAQSVLRLFQ